MLSLWKTGATRLSPKASFGTTKSFSSSVNKRLYSRLPARDNQFLQISSRVRDALANGEPVVALETTIYTHGFPYPDNLKLAQQIERLVHENGAVPAHIGVIDGRALIGMSDSEMSELLQQADKGKETIKLSRRDLGYIAGQRQLGRQINGGTTIAGTTVLAHLAGIQVFATGGLGGVHKGGEVSMDVSADLTELGRTPVALVSSGCKSFLDIPRTLEYLETQGVGVGTFADGREGSVDFPAFWTRNSGTPSPRTIRDEFEAAAIIHAQSELGLQSGLLFANPIAEEYSLAKEIMDDAMATAVRDAQEAGVTGHANTPYVLKRIREITEGKTVSANRELVFANVIRGAKVAHNVAKLQAKSSGAAAFSNSQPEMNESGASNVNSVEKPTKHTDVGHQAEVLVVGSVALDIGCDRTPTGEEADEWVSETSNRAAMKDSVGGVGGNIATAACYSGATTTLLSLVGNDAAGQAIRNHFSTMPHLHADLRSHEVLPTARYIAFNAQQKLSVAASDMRLFESDHIGADDSIRSHQTRPTAVQPKWLVLDTNWDIARLRAWLQSGVGQQIACEPVSVSKASRIVNAVVSAAQSTRHTRTIDLITPNEHELAAMANVFRKSLTKEELIISDGRAASVSATIAASDVMEALNASMLSSKVQSILQDCVVLLNITRCLMVTLGQHGVLMVKTVREDDPLRGSKDAEQFMTPLPIMDTATQVSISQTGARLYVRHFPATVLNEKIVSVNGAGDTFIGALLAGLASPNTQTEDVLVPIAQQAAALTLSSHASVSPALRGIAKLLRSTSS